MPELTLYHFSSCPFCQKVRYFIQENNISVSQKDISLDAGAREELMAIGGKSQVPCLVIDGTPMYESDDILKWLAVQQVK